MAMFHNPYNFIPAPPRKPEHEELGDHKPAGHDRYGKKLWSGRISVSLVSASPLLVPDSAGAWPNADETEHKHFPLRIGTDGKPYLPPTSIKGMLRSAYEAVTNSRMGILDKHDKRLGYRMPTSEGLKLVPARIEGDQVVFYNGTSQLGPNEPGTKINGRPLMYAAWAERSENFIIDEDHGKKVWAYLRLWDHGLFYFWNVETFKFTDKKPTQASSNFREEWHGCKPVMPVIRDYQPEWRQGYICATGFNIKKKNNERFFFTTTEPYRCPLTDKLREQWRALIDDYNETSKAHDLVDKNVVRSRHVLNAKEERELSDGTLCYARVDNKGSNWQALALYPVSISRKLHDLTPADLIPANLRAAASSKDLSPADRVFGWAHSNGNGAYRGQLRIGPVTCHALSRNDAIDTFGDEGVPLAILGQPKPQQVRFYVAKSVEGKAQGSGVDKEQAGYSKGKGIRGRKVYPHHANLRPRHWENPLEDRTQTFRDGAFQEYRRPHKANLDSDSKPRLTSQRNGWLLKSGEENEQRDKQNRSITEWVKPGVEFSFEIDVINLSDVELGALLWLLDLPDGHYHRFGGGKPLGFGSVRLTIHWGQTQLSDGESWRKYYEIIDEKPAPDEMNERAKLECIEAFKRTVGKIYGDGNFERAPMIKAFLQCARGFNAPIPIHYPRAYPNDFKDKEPLPPHPEGKAFEWFVVNEQIERNKLKHAHALPDLEKDGGLPVLKSK